MRKDIKERISRLLAACLLFFLCISAIARYYYVVNDAVVLGKMPCFVITGSTGNLFLVGRFFEGNLISFSEISDFIHLTLGNECT